MRLKNKKGQSVLEYAVLIALVIGALILLSFYIKGAVQGKIRESADDIGVAFDKEHGGYHRVTELKDPEVTHSAVKILTQDRGKDEGTYIEIPEGRTWRSQTLNVGEGSEVQWTEDSAVRTVDETSTTNTAILPPLSGDQTVVDGDK